MDILLRLLPMLLLAALVLACGGAAPVPRTAAGEPPARLRAPDSPPAPRALTDTLVVRYLAWARAVGETSPGADTRAIAASQAQARRAQGLSADDIIFVESQLAALLIARSLAAQEGLALQLRQLARLEDASPPETREDIARQRRDVQARLEAQDRLAALRERLGSPAVDVLVAHEAELSRWAPEPLRTLLTTSPRPVESGP